MQILKRNLKPEEIARFVLLSVFIFVYLFFFYGNELAVRACNGVVLVVGTDKYLPGHVWFEKMNFGEAKRIEYTVWIKEETAPGQFTEETRVLHANLYPFGSHEGGISGKSSTPFMGVPIVGLKILELKVEPQRGYGNNSF